MNKILTFIICTCFLSTHVIAQLPNGSIAPNFTALDIDGNEHNLYEILDQGKSVILDVSATWCGPCWDYHESGVLDDLYELYGPNGTDEMMIFMIEGDENTNTDCLYNLPGCNESSLGDWTEGVHYPIIDDHLISDAYQINYFPTIYHICSNRVITETGQVSVADLYAFNDVCENSFGSNNVGILSYGGFSGSFCGNLIHSPNVAIQNLGASNMNNASIELWLNGTLEETISWTGDLATYQIEEVVFSEIETSISTDIEVVVSSVNSEVDEDMSNNSVATNISIAPVYNDNILTFEILTDDYPAEIYWEMRSNGVLFYSGGNDSVLSANPTGVSEYMPSTTYYHELVLPGDQCYEFAIYDSYGDGIDGGGYFKVYGSDTVVLFEGTTFGSEDIRPFLLDGTSSINNNGAIVGYNDGIGSFCGPVTYVPEIQLMNLGYEPITSATIEMTSTPGGLISSQNWTGNINIGSTSSIELETITITESTNISIQILDINGATDEYEYNNMVSVDFENNSTESINWTMELQLDQYAFEIYWQLSNYAGDVLASGGNVNVGPNGGGQRIAQPGDPGVYAEYELVTESIVLPSTDDDCYTFLLVDDYGDGLVEGGGGSLKLSDEFGTEFLSKNLDTTPFEADNSLIDAGLDPSTSTVEILAVNDLNLFPNPSQNTLNIHFKSEKQNRLEIGVYNALGNLVKTIDKEHFTKGAHELKMNIEQLANGYYNIIIKNEKQFISAPFVILRH